MSRVLLQVGILICSSFIAASARCDAPRPIFIGDAIQQALDHNPDISKARETLNQSSADFSLALAKLFPTISAQAQANYLKDSPLLNYPNFGGEAYNQYQASLNLNQPLYDGGALFAGIRYNKKQQQINQYALDIQARTTDESVIAAFYTVLLNERMMQILQDTYEVDKEILKITERYKKIGRAQLLDLLQAQTQTALLPPQITQAQSQMLTAAGNLATLLRDLDASQIRVKGELVAPDPKWVRSMIKNKTPEMPDVLQARTQVDQFEDTRDIQMASYWPQLSLVGNIGRIAYAKTDLLSDAATAWSIGLQVSVPLFSGLSSIFQNKDLASQEKQLEYTETKTSDTVTYNQIQAEKNLDATESQLISSRLAAHYGRQSLDEAKKDWKLLTIDYLQYQTAEQAYLTAETGYYQAKYNYIIAADQYFDAVGIPISYLVSELSRLSAIGEKRDEDASE